jgi:hypothetical protein
MLQDLACVTVYSMPPLDFTVFLVCATGEAAALLPVVGMMLQFSPAEIKRCQEALAREKAAEGMVDASAMSSVDGSTADYGVLSGWSAWAFGGSVEGGAKRPA